MLAAMLVLLAKRQLGKQRLQALGDHGVDLAQQALMAAREELAAAETAGAVKSQRALQGLDRRLRSALHEQQLMAAAVEREKMAQAREALQQVVADRRRAVASLNVLYPPAG
jgi:hypothetical protein